LVYTSEAQPKLVAANKTSVNPQLRIRLETIFNPNFPPGSARVSAPSSRLGEGKEETRTCWTPTINRIRWKNPFLSAAPCVTHRKLQILHKPAIL
jgi:hypothetical protein